MRNALIMARKNICISNQMAGNEPTVTRSPDIFKVGGLVYMKRHYPSSWGLKWEHRFWIIKVFTPYNSVLKTILNYKSRKVNIPKICQANPLDILDADNIPMNNWERKERLLFTDESLPDLQWQKLQPQSMNKMCTTVQQSEVDAKPTWK